MKSPKANRAELLHSAAPYAHEQVRTTKQHVEPIHVLGNSAISCLAVSELPLHDQEYLNGPGAMEPHTHHKEEVYIFTRGNGYVVVDETFYPVGPGDVAYIPPDSLHSVVNESEGELEWAAFWWDIMEPQARNGRSTRKEDPDECNVFNDR